METEEVDLQIEETPAETQGEEEFEVVVEGEPEPERIPATKEQLASVTERASQEDGDEISEQEYNALSKEERRRVDKTRKRLNQMTWTTRERERQLEEERRIAEALTQYGHGAKNVIETLAKQNAELQRSLREQAILAREAQIAAAQNDYRAAREAADTEKEIAAAQRLTEFTQQKAMLAQYQVPEPWTPPPPPQRQQSAPITDPETAKWVERNQWFTEDATMRSYAVTFANQLANQGVAPESKTYYDYIDAEMRKRFPERFDTGTPTSKAEHSTRSVSRPPVATVTRTNGSTGGKRTIVMSAADAAVYKRAAERLGVPFKDYIKNIPQGER